MTRAWLQVLLVCLIAGCRTTPAPIDTPETDTIIDQIGDTSGAITDTATDIQDASGSLADTISVLKPDTVTVEQLAQALLEARTLKSKADALAVLANSLDERLASLRESHAVDNQKAAQSLTDSQAEVAKYKPYKALFYKAAGTLIIIFGIIAAYIFLRLKKILPF